MLVPVRCVCRLLTRLVQVAHVVEGVGGASLSCRHAHRRHWKKLAVEHPWLIQQYFRANFKNPGRLLSSALDVRCSFLTHRMARTVGFTGILGLFLLPAHIYVDEKIPCGLIPLLFCQLSFGCSRLLGAHKCCSNLAQHLLTDVRVLSGTVFTRSIT